MRRNFTAAAVLLAAALIVPAYAEAATTATPPSRAHVARKHTARRTAQRSANREVTYDRDSKDPNVGWHTEGGFRVCTQDCDNPEIPGSGYTCRDITFFGIPGRECDSSSF